MSIKDAVTEDAGLYQIKAANRVGATTKNGTLAIVTEPPSFITPLKDVTTQLGTTESFECVVAGIYNLNFPTKYVCIFSIL